LAEGGDSIDKGGDGRLTILIVGSDTRATGIGLTDTVMVMSLEGKSISALSIPRDTSHIPDPDGGTYKGRINSLLAKLRAGRTTHEALAEFEWVIENLLLIEIDYFALLRFDGFQDLVHEIEPVSVDIRSEVRDSKFWDDPKKPSGVYFPVASGYDLYAWQPGSNSKLCDGSWRSQPSPIASEYWCRRAMPFVRSRKGPGNSDFGRAHRQQDFMIAAMRRVIKRGNGSKLNSLVNRAAAQSRSGALTTNVPLTSANALELFGLLDGAKLNFQVVFRAPKYASHIPGGTAYELDLAAVRRVTREWFGSTGEPPPRRSAPPADPSGPSQPETPATTPVATQDASGTVTPAPEPASTGPLATPGEEVVAPVSEPGSPSEGQEMPAADLGAAQLLGILLAALLIGVAIVALFLRRHRLSNLPDRP
jgi:anionic cell wall polymer biosynthesis LytR-Cps2A-Psr (LCP) family protein